MAEILAPGIYVEEVSSGSRPIEAVGSGVAGFIGNAPPGGPDDGKPLRIDNWSQFRRLFNPTDSTAENDLANAVYGYFLNGGASCYVAGCGKRALSEEDSGLARLAQLEGVSIIAAPGRDMADDHEALIAAVEAVDNRMALLDGPATVEDVAVLTTTGSDGLKPRTSERGRAAFYFPRITTVNALDASKRSTKVPPSGHIAGMMMRVDALRGVHKAPANEALRGALGLSQQVTDVNQGTLNPVGVNCIRAFARDGIRVWGARTLAPSASDWRYISVRRTIDQIRQSIESGTRWVVFEPNDERLWKAITRDVTAFLNGMWRRGALQGATPRNAFFVKCDAETNPPEDIANGRLQIQIGVCPVKPAEFVIFSISQNMDGAGEETDA